MSGISDIYTETVNKSLGPYFATWLPDAPIKLGDYGRMEKKKFIVEGNIEDFGITLKIRLDESCDDQKFNSGKKTEITVIPKGSVSNGITYVNASLKIDFNDQQGVYFNAVNCKNDLIINTKNVADKIIELYNEKKWDINWVVVTKMIRSESTTILISGNKISNILLEANADVQELNLADPSLKLNINYQKNIGFSCITKVGLIPLIGLSKLQKKIFNEPKLRSFDRMADVQPFDKMHDVTRNNYENNKKVEYKDVTILVFDEIK